MNFFEKIIHSLEGTMTTPTNYGWFHLMFIAIILVGTILICKYFKNCNENTFNIIALVAWVTVVLLEIYKQVEYTFEYSDGVAKWDYQFYAFPFQLCSSQMYILPFVFLLKEGKIRDAMISYLTTFSFFGGLVVFIYPNDVFVSTIGINIQTMIHHGLQILLGVFFFVRNKDRIDLKFYIKGIFVFIVMLFTALLMNVIVRNILVNAGNDETFNMFYIGPYFECTLPLLSIVYSKVPYICFFLIYMLGFILISFIIYIVETNIYKLVLKIKDKYEKQEA